jgi:hypothetical protein
MGIHSSCRVYHWVKHRSLLHHLRLLLWVYHRVHLLHICSCSRHDLIIDYRLYLLLILISDDLLHTEIIINACFNLHILFLLSLLKCQCSLSLTHFYYTICSYAKSDKNQRDHYPHNNRCCSSVSCVAIVSVIVIDIIVATIAGGYNNCTGSWTGWSWFGGTWGCCFACTATTTPATSEKSALYFPTNLINAA